MKKKTYSLEVGGRELVAEFTDLANQANGSVMVRYGNTTVLATAVMGKNPKDGDFFPLTVDYEERFYASGKILGSRFVRREGKPSDEAILSGRVVDRTIRPLFDQRMRHEVQVVLTVLSIEQDDPDVPAVIAASLALGTSNIPWNGPVSAVRISKNDTFHVNPTYVAREEASTSMDLVACGKDGLINMIEVGAKEVPEAIVAEGLTLASKEIERIQAWQQSIISEIGAPKKTVTLPEITPGTAELFAEAGIAARITNEVFGKPGKDALNSLNEEWLTLFKERMPEGDAGMAQSYFDDVMCKTLQDQAIDHNRRIDGRGLDEIRPLFAQAGGISPVLHGAGVFYRGETHILSVLTLGGPGDAQVIDGMETTATSGNKRFMHHYNFPPFSTGEVGRMGGTNRRMIGHGALAEKALLPIIPAKEVFPYTIRLVSEAFASNGSTSMGSVCGSTLALMDGGVPIKAPVAGISSGLVMRNHKEYKILTDIQGPEDHHGDMDFKVAGTAAGITAMQMDVKVLGVPVSILTEALEKARAARMTILGVITKAIAAPRADIAPTAPKILLLTIKPDQIGLVIGSGGKTINDIRDKTGVEDITIEDDGTIFITGKNGSAEKARDIIANMTREFKVGDKLNAPVVKIMEFGAFVNLAPNVDGLVHVSEMASFRIDRIEKYLKEGDIVPVIVKEVTEKDGKKKFGLSIKDVDPNFIKKVA